MVPVSQSIDMHPAQAAAQVAQQHQQHFNFHPVQQLDEVIEAPNKGFQIDTKVLEESGSSGQEISPSSIQVKIKAAKKQG